MTKRRFVVIIGAVSLLAGCSEELQVLAPRSTAFVRGRPGEPTGDELREAKRLARELSHALASADSRAELFDGLAKSSHPEAKLHLKSFVRGRAKALLRASSHTNERSVVDMLDSLPDLELYMPVPEHRRKWMRGTIPAVAVALSEDAAPVAVDQAGNERVLSRDYPPTEPTLIIAPLETNLTEQVAANERGHPESSCQILPDQTLDEAHHRCLKQRPTPTRPQLIVLDTSGVFMEHIELDGDQCGRECWFWGDPEYELHVKWTDSPQSTSFRDRQCIASDPINGYNAGIKGWQFRWDMNGRRWTTPQRLLSGAQLDTAQANGGFVIELWEDDTTECLIRGTAVSSISLDFLLCCSWMTKGFWVEGTGMVAVGLVGAAATLYILLDAFNGGDDFLGRIVEAQGPFNSTAQLNAIITRTNVLVGRARIVARDGTPPPPPGPTTSVVVSEPDGQMMPIGAQKKLDAWAVDADGRTAADRLPVWSSATPATASVTTDGWITTLASGTATVTATIDGISKSVSIQAVPYGDVASVVIAPGYVSLSGYDQLQLTALFYDSNGFQLPIGMSSVDSFQALDPSICSVTADGRVWPATQSAGWTTITATVDGFQSEPITCAVNGNTQMSQTPTRTRQPIVRPWRPSGQRR